MTVEEILDEMEGLLLEAARLPFSNKRMVEEDDLGRLIDELREVLPSEVLEAKRIINDRQRIMEEAQKEAQGIVDQAKNYIHKLTDENAITRQAQDQANEIIHQAQKTSRELKGDSIAYADEVFSYLEDSLEKTLEVVRQSHGKMHQSKHE
ncbi:MAG TPA: HrpE/YscL family type III secretion apparatus protein [Selenomonadales bacterium]|nr:HrpE/YscL family type III secretion apparatus protein [Selenomonadales bacterium]